MERDDFIITVYCLVCEHYQAFENRYCQHRTLRGGSFAPALSDEEVITIELCGEHFKQHSDRTSSTTFTATTGTSSLS
jgi:hypothetical protein